MRVDGGCHCGKITYEADINPDKDGLCHCTDCQTLTSSAFSLFVPVAKENFRLRGEPRVYVKTAESGNRRAQAFCPECGTRIYASARRKIRWCSTCGSGPRGSERRSRRSRSTPSSRCEHQALPGLRPGRRSPPFSRVHVGADAPGVQRDIPNLR